jgi:hypothetical protein
LKLSEMTKISSVGFSNRLCKLRRQSAIGSESVTTQGIW